METQTDYSTVPNLLVFWSQVSREYAPCFCSSLQRVTFLLPFPRTTMLMLPFPESDIVVAWSGINVSNCMFIHQVQPTENTGENAGKEGGWNTGWQEQSDCNIIEKRTSSHAVVETVCVSNIITVLRLCQGVQYLRLSQHSLRQRDETMWKSGECSWSHTILSHAGIQSGPVC